MSRKIKIGDVVARATDGPTMVVEECAGDRIRCVWFGIDHRAQWTGPHRRRFLRDEIVLVCAHQRRRKH